MSSDRRAFRFGVLIWKSTRAAVAHDVMGEAAAMAFYFFLALFPVILVVFTLTGFLGGDAAFRVITSTAEQVIPAYAWQFVRGLIDEITRGRRPGLLSLGIVLTFWSASNGVAALTKGLNTYAVREPRAWWKRRLLALAVMFGGVLFLVAGAAAFIPGKSWVDALGLGPLWRVLRWPLGICLPSGTVWLAYRFLPARDQRGCWRETMAGALVAGALLASATLLLRVYLANFNKYSQSYGAIGAVIVLLMWFYLVAMAVLFGGEVAATLEADRGPNASVARSP